MLLQARRVNGEFLAVYAWHGFRNDGGSPAAMPCRFTEESFAMFSLFSNRAPSNRNPHEGRRRVAEGALLLDVRTPQEFAGGHVEGAKNIPVQDLARRIAELGPPRQIVVYCRSGGRSASAAQMLRQAGHDVLDVGPMSAY